MTAASAKTSPFSYFEWMVARRYLGATRSGKGVSLISMIAFGGIMLAVAALISVMSIMQGFRLTLLDQLLGTNGHAHVQAEEPISGYDLLADRLAQIGGCFRGTFPRLHLLFKLLQRVHIVALY